MIADGHWYYNYHGKFLDIPFVLPCLSGLIKGFAFFGLCDLNPTS